MPDAGCRMQKNQDPRTKIQIKKTNKKNKKSKREEEGGNVSYTFRGSTDECSPFASIRVLHSRFDSRPFAYKKLPRLKSRGHFSN